MCAYQLNEKTYICSTKVKFHQYEAIFNSLFIINTDLPHRMGLSKIRLLSLVEFILVIFLFYAVPSDNQNYLETQSCLKIGHPHTFSLLEIQFYHMESSWNTSNTTFGDWDYTRWELEQEWRVNNRSRDFNFNFISFEFWSFFMSFLY